MSQIIEEQLSAFLDGEIPPDEIELLLARVDREPARRATLARYAMIGECLRSGSALPAAVSVAEHVRTALLADARPAAVVPMRVGSRIWLTGGLAAAAAIVAILVAGPPTPRNEPVQAVDQGDNSPRVLADEPVMGITTLANRRLNPRAAARLTGYLVAHGEYANELSRSTFDSHLVSARAERAAWRQPQDANYVR